MKGQMGRRIINQSECIVCKNIFQPKSTGKNKNTKTCSVKCAAVLRKGVIPWNKGKKGTLKHSEKTKKQMSIDRKGKNTWSKNRKLSPEHKEKLLDGRKGLSPIPKGTPWSEVRRKAQPTKKPYKMNGKEYDPNWREIRREIYIRDKGKCRECGIKTTNQNDGKYKTTIQCHHIDFNIKNNSDKNLITLCASCHGKTRFKKIDWIKYYQNKIKKGI